MGDRACAHRHRVGGGRPKWVIPAILDTVARHTDDEEFLLAVLVVAVGDHRDRAIKKILPFQVLFAAVFFASIGMLPDPQTIIDLWPVILFFCVVVVVVKLIGTGVAAKVFKRPWPVVAALSFVLAQVGEFAFILEKIGRDAGLSPADRGEDGSQVFIAVRVALIALTPLLFTVGRRCGPAEHQT